MNLWSERSIRSETPITAPKWGPINLKNSKTTMSRRGETPSRDQKGKFEMTNEKLSRGFALVTYDHERNVLTVHPEKKTPAGDLCGCFHIAGETPISLWVMNFWVEGTDLPAIHFDGIAYDALEIAHDAINPCVEPLTVSEEVKILLPVVQWAVARLKRAVQGGDIPAEETLETVQSMVARLAELAGEPETPDPRPYYVDQLYSARGVVSSVWRTAEAKERMLGV